MVTIEPMTKFPVIRDLWVDRSSMFEALKKLNCWIPVDGYYDLGPGPRISPELQQECYPLSECMACGCCLDACLSTVAVTVSPASLIWYGHTAPALQFRTTSFSSRGDSPLIRPPIL